MASTPKLTAQDRAWRAEDALRTIARAEEIRRDAGLMRDVKKVAAKQIQSLSRVTRKK